MIQMEELKRVKLFKSMVKSTATNLKILSDIDAAYLAGLFDGDGCFFIMKVNKKFRHNRSHGYVPYMRLTNTDRIIIDLCNEYGGHWLSQDQTAKWKCVYRWMLSTRLAKWYLPQIFPYIRIKRKQAGVFLKALEQCHGTGHSQDKLKMGKYRMQLQLLNRRGKKKGRLP